ncbi:MAG: hypothetical protein WDN30_11315 [Pararobbsia sp.]
MTVIEQDDSIQNIADPPQSISDHRPLDYVRALGSPHEVERSLAAKDAIAPIVIDGLPRVKSHSPICEDANAAPKRSIPCTRTRRCPSGETLHEFDTFDMLVKVSAAVDASGTSTAQIGPKDGLPESVRFRSQPPEREQRAR